MAVSDRPFESLDTVQAWERRARVRSLLMAEATKRMLDAAQLEAGYRVLDIGTGTGDTALLAAERVDGDGQVVAIDASDAMIGQAAEHVREAGATNVELRVMDASDLELEDAMFDAVIGRNAMMFLTDWPAPLHGFHRVLRPGGRLSFIVWASQKENPYFYLPVALARKHGWMRGPDATLESPFRLADVGSLFRDLERAHFRDVAVEPVRSDVTFNDRAPLLAYIREGPMYHANADQLDDRERAAFERALEAAFEDFRSGDGYRITAVSLLATGTR